MRDRQGTTLGAYRADGTPDPQSWYQPLGAFGAPAGDGSSTSGGKSSATATGFTGAGAPSASGGYVYLRNRWYDPATGRFLSQDPIGLAGGVNLYAYAGNDPVNFSDPFGLAMCPTEAGGDGKTDRYDDCLSGTPGWYANRIATGRGNKTLNQIGGWFAELGRNLTVSATAGDGTVTADTHALLSAGKAGSVTGSENLPVASLPQLGASVDFTVGDVDDIGRQVNIGLGKHDGLSINFSARTGHVNGFTLHFGASTPQIPVTASENTDKNVILVPPLSPSIPGDIRFRLP